MIEYRQARVEDAQEIANLFFEHYKRHTDVNNLERRLQEYPAVVAFSGNTFVGFANSGRFAPDILEMHALVVKNTHRNQGIGTQILKKMAEASKGKWQAIILSNSLSYPEVENKRSAANFYTSNGYQEIFSTHKTKVFCQEI